MPLSRHYKLVERFEILQNCGQIKVGGIWWDISISTKKDIKRQTNTNNGIRYHYIVAVKNTMECHWAMTESGLLVDSLAL